MNWPKYLVWDLHQENFIKRAVDNNPKIEIVGPNSQEQMEDSTLAIGSDIKVGDKIEIKNNQDDKLPEYD